MLLANIFCILKVLETGSDGLDEKHVQMEHQTIHKETGLEHKEHNITLDSNKMSGSRAMTTASSDTVVRRNFVGPSRMTEVERPRRNASLHQYEDPGAVRVSGPNHDSDNEESRGSSQEDALQISTRSSITRTEQEISALREIMVGTAATAHVVESDEEEGTQMRSKEETVGFIRNKLVCKRMNGFLFSCSLMTMQAHRR